MEYQLDDRIGKFALKIKMNHSFRNIFLFQINHLLWNGESILKGHVIQIEE